MVARKNTQTKTKNKLPLKGKKIQHKKLKKVTGAKRSSVLYPREGDLAKDV